MLLERKTTFERDQDAGAAIAPRQAWQRVKARLKVELGEDVFSSWFLRLELDRVEGETVFLSVPTRFLKSWIQSHYADGLRRHCQREFVGVEQVSIAIRTPHKAGQAAEVVKATPSEPVLRPAAASPQPESVIELRPGASDVDVFGVSLDRRLSFASFLVGRSNALAFAAAERVASSPGATALYNPLYLHAGVGLGKTHLLHAIAQDAMARGRKVAYFGADRFMYGFVTALKSHTALSFKEKLRSIDILIIDDVQFIQGKHVQQEFGHTLNALIDAGKQVVVAADRLPMDLESLDERIRSRLAGGLAVEIGALDDELRQKILKARVQALQSLHSGFEVSPEVLAYVATAVATNGRDLDGAANRLLAHATLTGTAHTVETAEAAIRDLVRSREPKRLKIEDIQKMVATRYNVTRADILSDRRTAAVVRPRQIAMFLSKTLTPRSLPEIGRRFGGRDHTTVLHAVRKIERELSSDRSLTDEVELLKRMLLE